MTGNTTAAVVGDGPAGTLLGLLLARAVQVNRASRSSSTSKPSKPDGGGDGQPRRQATAAAHPPLTSPAEAHHALYRPTREATVAAVEHGSRGVYNVVDDDPAPVAEWLPALASELGAKQPMHVPRFIGRLFAGEAGVVMMTDARGASNAKAKRELAWRPAHPSWRRGFAAA
jgi:hypothetical protein